MKRKPGVPFAKKSFGQNFLVDQKYINKIIEAVRPAPGDTIVEIGPGRGALTRRLIETGANVIALELDRDLLPLLESELGAAENFRLVQQDALKADFAELLGSAQPVKLVANLPYYISTAILQELIEQRHAFSVMVLMFQREVVERITAPPGNAERGFLTVIAEMFLNTERLFDVPPKAFRPAPKIWSSVARLTPLPGSDITDPELFRELASSAFRQKRKTILNNLKTAAGIVADPDSALETAGIDPTRRAETLTREEWLRLFGAVQATQARDTP